MEWRKIAYHAALILCGFILAGAVHLMFGQPRGKAIQLAPVPTRAPLKVFISGAVANPGIYELRQEDRLADLIELAGGFLDSAAGEYNLSAKLYDGQHVIIRSIMEIPQGERMTAEISGKININEADITTLCTLPGIGETKAGDIVHYREQNGFFDEIEDILNVPGIGESTYNQIKGFIVTNQIAED